MAEAVWITGIWHVYCSLYNWSNRQRSNVERNVLGTVLLSGCFLKFNFNKYAGGTQMEYGIVKWKIEKNEVYIVDGQRMKTSSLDEGKTAIQRTNSILNDKYKVNFSKTDHK